VNTRNDDPDPDTRTASYGLVMAIYAGLAAGGTVVARRRGIEIPRRFSVFDLALAAMATWRIGRLLSKDTITRPLREPFTEYRGVSGPSELDEAPRTDSRMRHAVGELVSCPFCVAQWVATALIAGLVVWPRPTRLVTSLFAVVGASDLLQDAMVRLRPDDG
jgi:hypothetical protein